MTIEVKNTTPPVSEQDLLDARYFVEHRLDFLVFDENPKVEELQRKEWQERQDAWRQQVENGDPTVIRSLADQLRQQKEIEEQRLQRHQKHLGQAGIAEYIAA